MKALFPIILIVAVILAIFGGLFEAVNFLLWVALILGIIAIIGWLLSAISGRNR